MPASRMKHGVGGSDSPNQKGKTSSRPMAALATARTREGENLGSASCSFIVRDKVAGCKENASLCILMRIVPQGLNHLRTGREKILDILGKSMGFFALDIDRPQDALCCSIEDWNNDLGAGGAKRSQVAGIGGDVANIHDLSLGDGCTGWPLSKRKRGMCK